MKIVFDPKSKQVITIDETKEKTRKKKYYHRSWVPFEGADEPKIKDADYEDLSNEKLCELIEEKFGKAVPNTRANRRTYLLKKLQD